MCSLDAKKRKRVEEKVARLSKSDARGRAAASVSGERDYLVRGTNPGRTKTAAAKERDVLTIDEEEFLRLIGRKE